jgi:hypothetical protein
MTDQPPTASEKGGIRRTALRLAVVVVLALAIHQLLNWANAEAELGTRQLRPWMLALFLLVYALLIAIPFVPGVEVGLTLMAMKGPWIAPWIYAATVVGLVAAYAAGEGFSYPRLHRILADLHLNRACRLIERLQPLTKADRLALLKARAPRWARPFVSRFRYVMMAALINLPGNTLIGGGGGLMFLSGFSRLFHAPAMILTIFIAVAPVPLAVWLFGLDVRSLF